MTADPRPRIALVTGGSRGIGAAIARKLASCGVRVAVTGRAQTDLEAVAASVGGLAIVADLIEPGAAEQVVTRVEADLGPIDVLVNNAGVAESAPLEKVTDEAWARTFDVNVTSVFRLCRAIVPGMARRGFGRVINVASNAGLTGYAYTSAYCASKHAVVGLTRALAAEFARSAVTINAVCPGFVDTDMAQRAADRIAATTKRDGSDARKVLEAMSPQRRLMTVDEVAHAVTVLIDDESRGIHGQCIVVDGGQVMS